MCPFCNLRIHELSKRYLFYRSRGLEIILISESTRSTILESSFFPTIELAIIPDPGRELYKLYKVELSYLKTGASFLNPDNVGVLWSANQNGMPIKTEQGTNIHRIPAEFLVDEKGNIYEAHYGKSIADSISSSTIETFLTQSLPEEVVL